MNSPPDQPSSRGDRLEKIAFAYCRIATVALLCGRFALPVAAVLSAGLYAAAWLNGKRDTKCWLGDPRLPLALWTLVAALWIYAEILGPKAPFWLILIHR